ncbi:cystathione beta-lyase [Lacrimispora sphenoides]|jgi:cystathionine beta-lyase|uniref:MalY/PatB family protein n=1 Tax=Lacrimispora sphenoides TaxID=29370 RepID=UPI0008B492DC|nr:MalY/PatB family protein [Lacrimispora sphenoides]SEU06686.1 cystathione beta-lyase [Lacrimispora sphenoides]
MCKETINFDEVINRKNTNSLKYDFAVRRRKPENLLPLWVADMDFKVSGKILEALHERVDHGIFGYSEVQEDYFEAIRDWMGKKHHWNVESRWLIKTPGVVFALAMAVQAFTDPGDGVMIQQPVYYPFSEVIEDNDRVVVDNSLYLGKDGKYHMDLEDFERIAEEFHVKLFLLCSPHNPVGRVWSQEELEKLGEICIRRDILVVSDEIHQDFVFEGEHLVFAKLSEELKNRTISCTSPSKTFNLAGLQISNIFIANQKLRRRFRRQVAAAGYSQLNTLGLTACEAAYRHGEEWHDQLMEYLKANVSYVREFLKEKIPNVKLIEPEGTYLVWLDFRELGLTEGEREDLIIKKAGLWLDSGAMFGPVGEGFERINIACPRSILEQALGNLEQAIKTL